MDVEEAADDSVVEVVVVMEVVTVDTADGKIAGKRLCRALCLCRRYLLRLYRTVSLSRCYDPG